MPFLITIILAVVLVISFITDIRTRRILNIVTLPAILFGLIYYTVTLGWEGLLFSGAGFLVGLLLLLIPYLLGGMGAGDVKLLAAIGALTGVSFVFYSFIYTAIIGGVISIFLIMKKRGVVHSIRSFIYMPLLKSTKGSFTSHSDRITFPYGVAIVFGTVIAYVGRVWV
ncbi:A24 family peptidase [Salipaludibacillus daqingensis]|uniref:A24 family peptidase n=1 Tax=Salipaludibacillus daqingensis TaxID=3041001 RepID=UPI0024731044|nr:A24 family peptidase [Salipaludibacillus daqingensis]